MDEQKTLTVFDESDTFNEKLAPLLKKIDTICKANKIPFFFAACVKNDEKDSTYEYVGNLCGSNEFVLKDDKITDFIRILCGFKLQIADNNPDNYTLNIPGEDIEIEFTD